MSKPSRIAVLLVVVLAIAGIVFLKGGFRVGVGNVAENTSARLPELVDLGSNYCIPCKKMAPILAELATEYGGRVKVTVIDVKEDREAGRRHGIRVIPTQIFFDAQGREVRRHEWFLAKRDIVAQFEAMGVR
jgi:thioredoxin 1